MTTPKDAGRDFGSSDCSSASPFDFLTDFDGWWHYQLGIHRDKLTPEQAAFNVRAARSGWVLIPGMKYGGWTVPNAYRRCSTCDGSGRVWDVDDAFTVAYKVDCPDCKRSA